MHFRLTRTQCETLIVNMNRLQEAGNPRRPPIDLKKQVLMTLWYLANIESFRSVANRFGVAKSTFWSVVGRICEKIIKINAEYKIIAWPNDAQKRRIKEGFERIGGLPGVIGAIDGCHVRITAPKVSPSSYINRKNFHSILIQGICDHSMKFTDCYIGEVGSIHDACMFKRSPLKKSIDDKEILIDESEHLVGDSAYPLEMYLMTPYKNDHFLTDREINFNNRLSKCRVKIEQAFGLLKTKFRRLKLVETKRSDLIVLLISSCCVLHNICLQDTENDDDEFLDDTQTEQNEISTITQPENEYENSNARVKRRNLTLG